jgi:D-alanyl-D-alanine carboxypeptidase
VLILLLACHPADPPLDPALQADLQAALDDGRSQIGAPGATLTVIVPDHARWTGVSGLADVAAGRPVVAGDRFGIGSITKTFVAAVLLQLDAEAVVSIDDTVATWVPDAPHADEITLRQVMSQTSGLDDYTDDPALLEAGRVWTPEELLAHLADRPLLFEPGTGWSYSNAGYVELGLVIEAATGHSYGTEVHARLLDPLGMVDTFVPSEDDVPGGTSHGYLGTTDWLDVTESLDPSVPWCAGEIVSNGADLATWAQALYGGDVLPADELAEMTTAVELPDGRSTGYGLACFVETVAGHATVGHSGSTMGFQSELRYEPATGEVAVTLVNDFLSDADVIDAGAWEALP